MRDSGLVFDDENCDDCGLCVAACSTEALTLPAPVFLIRTQPSRCGLIACECAVAVPPEGASAGHAACLYALAPGWLWRQADARRVESIVAATGDCAMCPRGSAGGDWHRQWSVVAQARGQGRPAPALQIVEPRTWQALASATEETVPTRRAFFRRLARPTHAETDTDVPLSSSRQWLIEQLAGAGHAPLWEVKLDETRCSACLSCARLCPTQALQVAAADAGNAGDHQFVIDMARCIGCGLCMAVCDSAALTVPAGGASTRACVLRRLRLHQQACQACGTPFHRLPRPASDAAPQGALCRACEHGRLVQHNRIVQTGRPARSPP
jgi:ferredoxin